MSVGPAAVAAIALLWGLVGLSALAGQDTAAAAGARRLSSSDIELAPPETPSSFRFLPEGKWILFDRPLALSAARGEERLYRLELRSPGGADTIESYLIDKRPPSPPSAGVPSGIYRKTLTIRLSAAEGASVFWTLVGPASGTLSAAASDSGFRRASGGPVCVLEPPKRGSATYTLFAYAVDRSGNRSRPAVFTYRLAGEGLSVAPLPKESGPPSISFDDSLPLPTVESSPGEVDLSAAAGRSLCLAVDPPARPDSPYDFVQAPLVGDRFVFRITCPYGWSGSLPVYYAYFADGKLLCARDPIFVSLVYGEKAAQPVPPPPAPVLARDPLGRGAFLFFPDYDGSIYVKVGSAPERRYQEPFALSGRGGQVSVVWAGEDAWGRRSAESEITFDQPPAAPDLDILGAGEGARTAGDVSLSPSAPGVLRYEIGTVESPPGEPTASSPRLVGSLSVDCPAGRARHVLVRYRSFSGPESAAVGGDEKDLSFTIDKRPPPAPLLAGAIPAYADRPLSLTFAKTGPEVSIFASVSVGGAPADFARVDAPLDLGGSEAGPVQYRVRAYAVDDLGNRSAEMEPVGIVVDRDSLYAAEGGSPEGDGSPQRPFGSLEAALRSAAALGKRNINLRGDLTLSSPIELDRDIVLQGGYAADWSVDPERKAAISAAIPGDAAAIAVRGARLSLRNLDMRAGGRGGCLLSASGGAELDLEGCTLSAKGEGDFVLARLRSSTGGMRDSTIAAEAAVSCTAVDAADSDIRIAKSVVVAGAAVHAFNAFLVRGGSLALDDSLVESSADLALSLFDLGGSSLSMRRDFVKVSGGSGYLRIGNFADAPGFIRDCRFEIAWRGEGTLFSLRAAAPTFLYDTILAATGRGSIRYFEARHAVLRVWDSILSCASGGSELVRTDESLGAGALVADCIWGFPRLVAGAMDLRSLDALDALNAASGLYSTKRHVSEPPQATFSAPVKGVARLSPSSACVGAALPFDDANATDFLGNPRPGRSGPGSPDIGAEELPP
ncbi:MAG TPA: hypothetical protein VMV90_06045 [Rectinemataceae bacterium]|nr:hypothetical protein [Rectinemataceae bacterium]